MLNGKEKKELRSAGNRLKPEVWIGKEGVTDGIVNATKNAFNTKELVKLKILENCEEDKESVARRLSDETESEVVQIVGNVILLYHPLPEEDS